MNVYRTYCMVFMCARQPMLDVKTVELRDAESAMRYCVYSSPLTIVRQVFKGEGVSVACPAQVQRLRNLRDFDYLQIRSEYREPIP